MVILELLIKGGRKSMINKIEYEQALKIAKEIDFRLDQAQQELKSSSRWGLLDLVTKSWIISIFKRNRMEEADWYLNRIDELSQQLQKELGDINIKFQNETLKSKKGKILDIFLDNPISDFFAQSRISKSLDQIEEYKKEISELIVFLEEKIR